MLAHKYVERIKETNPFNQQTLTDSQLGARCWAMCWVGGGGDIYIYILQTIPKLRDINFVSGGKKQTNIRVLESSCIFRVPTTAVL